MNHVVCHCSRSESRFFFRWSAGNEFFEPYYLSAAELHAFDQTVQSLKTLFRRIDASKNPQSSRLQYVTEAAKVGHQLYRQMFSSSGQFDTLGLEIRQWLELQDRNGKIQSIEMVGDAASLVPWALVFDQELKLDLLPEPNENWHVWQPFWGVRYPLSTAQKVNHLRLAEVLTAPSVLVAIDPNTLSTLPSDHQSILRRFTGMDSALLADSASAFADELESAVPDVLVLVAPACDGGFQFDGRFFGIDELRSMLANSKNKRTPWNHFIFFAGLFDDSDSGTPMQNAKALHKLRLSGLIVPSRPVSSEITVRFLNEFLDGFLQRGDPFGRAVQNARSAALPDGLFFEASAPAALATLPRISAGQVDRRDSDDNGEESFPLPDSAYFPLTPLDREERAFLVGRDDDIGGFCDLLDGERTRIAILQGRVGVGKSSMLRAGVIPFLNEDAIGYLSLRDRSERTDAMETEFDYPIVSIRATNDLMGQLASVLDVFSKVPFAYETPTGREVSVDLAVLLRKAMTERAEASSTSIAEGLPASQFAGHPEEHVSKTKIADTPRETTVSHVYHALKSDVSFLSRFLNLVSERIPFEPVLLIEQAEEMFSLSRTGDDVRKRNHALSTLANCADHLDSGKVILSVTTGYFGRFLARLLEHMRRRHAVSHYLLPALNVDQLAKVIELPTLNEPIDESDEIPHEKYGVQYTPELPKLIAREAIRAVNEGNDESLPAVHALCFLLFQDASERIDKTVTEADLKRLLGVKSVEQAVRAALQRYVSQLVSAGVMPTEHKKLYTLMQTMYSRQSDGSLIRSVHSEGHLAEQWKGKTPFSQVVQSLASPEISLFDERMTVADNREQILVSLSHDAVVPAIDRQHQENEVKKRVRSKVQDTLWICIPIMLLLIMAGYSLVYRPMRQELADSNETIKKATDNFQEQAQALVNRMKTQYVRPLYASQMQSVYEALQQNDFLQARQILLRWKSTLGAPSGFEWNYLWNRLHPAKHELEGHLAGITSVNLASSDDLVFTCDAAGFVRAWNAKVGLPVPIQHADQGLSAHYETMITSAALSSDGKTLATAGADHTVKLWDYQMVDGTMEIKLKKTLEGHDAAVNGLAFAESDSGLISISDDKTVKIWNVSTGKVIITLKDHEGPVKGLAVSADGKTFATFDPSSILIWNLAEKKKTHEVKKTGGEVLAMAFSTDGKKLAASIVEEADAAAANGVIKLWNADTGKAENESILFRSKVLSLSFTGDNKSLLVTMADRSAALWNLKDKKMQQRFQGHLGAVTCHAMNQKTNTLVTGSLDATATVWDLAKPPGVIPQAHKGGVLSVAITENDQYIATGGNDGNVKIWDSDAGNLLHTFSEFKSPVHAVAVAMFEDTPIVAAGGGDGKIVIWDMKSGKKSKELQGHTKRINGLSFSADGGILGSASEDGTWKLWSVSTGKSEVSIKGQDNPVRCISLAEPGLRIAVGEKDGRLHPFLIENNLLTERRFGEPPSGLAPKRNAQLCHAGSVTGVLETKYTDARIVSAGTGGSLIVWDEKTGLPLWSLKGHAGPITALAGNETKRNLVTSGTDGSVKLWDLATGNNLLTFRDHQGLVTGVAMSGSGNTIVSVGMDETIRIYRAGKK